MRNPRDGQARALLCKGRGLMERRVDAMGGRTRSLRCHAITITANPIARAIWIYKYDYTNLKWVVPLSVLSVSNNLEVTPGSNDESSGGVSLMPSGKPTRSAGIICWVGSTFILKSPLYNFEIGRLSTFTNVGQDHFGIGLIPPSG